MDSSSICSRNLRRVTERVVVINLTTVNTIFFIIVVCTKHNANTASTRCKHLLKHLPLPVEHNIRIWFNELAHKGEHLELRSRPRGVINRVVLRRVLVARLRATAKLLAAAERCPASTQAACRLAGGPRGSPSPCTSRTPQLLVGPDGGSYGGRSTPAPP
jgi:hypothetical protein